MVAKAKKSQSKGNAKSESGAVSTGKFATYLAESKNPYNAILLVLPLFVLYQIGILGAGGVRNGVDFMTDILIGLVKFALLSVGSADSDGVVRASSGEVLVGYVVVNLVIGIGLAGAVWALREKGRFRAKLWPWLLLESLVYALFFGAAVNLMMRVTGVSALLAVPGLEAAGLEAAGLEAAGLEAAGLEAAGPVLATGVEGMSTFQKLIMSVGAGLYEEIVFRLLLMSGLFWLLQSRLKMGAIASAVIAVLASSFVFSAIHHFGSLGDPFTLGVFAYRFFAGMLLAVIFSTRGFAVAVYTHAIYDVIVLVLRGGG